MFHMGKGEMRTWSGRENRKLWCGESFGPYATMTTYQQLQTPTTIQSGLQTKKRRNRQRNSLKDSSRPLRRRGHPIPTPNYAKGELFTGILAEGKMVLDIRKENVYNQSAEQRMQIIKHKFKKVQDMHHCLIEAVGEMQGKDVILDCVWNNPEDSWYSR